MDATPIDFSSSGATGVMPLRAADSHADPADSGAMAMTWTALHDAADIVAALAGIAAESLPADARDFPAAIAAAGGWRRGLAQQGIEDLAAMMEPGLCALLAVHARGTSPAAAALALWQEFDRARSALLGLLPPGEEMPNT